MRPVRLMFAVVAALTVSSGLAAAQTFDPAYPVCIRTYAPRGGEMTDCSYTSLAQCRATASGRAAMCLENPFYAGPVKPQRSRKARWHRHRVYR